MATFATSGCSATSIHAPAASDTLWRGRRGAAFSPRFYVYKRRGIVPLAHSYSALYYLQSQGGRGGGKGPEPRTVPLLFCKPAAAA